MKNLKSTLAVLFCGMALFYMTFSRPHNQAIGWDVFGYYLYLPATFYHHDIQLKDISWAEAARAEYNLSGTLYQLHHVSDGHHVIQYTSGMAIMYLPAFAAGHYAASITGHKQDGFSEPYQLAISIWSCLVACAGLYVLRKLLLNYFSDEITAVVILLIVFATNYFVTLGRSPALSHNYLFLCYALLLHNTIRWHNSKEIINMAGMALPLGMACLTRPTELVAILIPVFWDTDGVKSAWQKIKSTILHHRNQLMVFVAIMFLCAMPQLLYWKTVTGHFIFNSYANPGEGFDFLTPHTFNFLFSFRKGWLLYTPLILIALMGVVYVWRNHKSIRLSLVIFILLNLFIVSSWSCWWYAQCYSQRAMIQSYPVIALLLGFVLLWMSKWSQTKRITGAIVIVLLSALTVFQSWQYDNYILDGSRITKDFYFAVFGKTKIEEEDKKLLLINRSMDGSLNFEDRSNYTSSLLFRYDSLPAIAGSAPQPVDTSMHKGEWLSEQTAFSKEFKIKWKDLTTQDHCWLIVEADVFCPEDFKSEDLCIVTTVERKGDNYGYFAGSIPADSITKNSWNKLTYQYLTPEVRSPHDKIKIYGWYRGKSRVFLKNIEVTKWEPK